MDLNTSRTGVFIGADFSNNTYLVYFPDTSTLVNTAHVRFLPVDYSTPGVQQTEEKTMLLQCVENDLVLQNQVEPPVLPVLPPEPLEPVIPA